MGAGETEPVRWKALDLTYGRLSGKIRSGPHHKRRVLSQNFARSAMEAFFLPPFELSDWKGACLILEQDGRYLGDLMSRLDDTPFVLHDGIPVSISVYRPKAQQKEPVGTVPVDLACIAKKKGRLSDNLIGFTLNPMFFSVCRQTPTSYLIQAARVANTEEAEPLRRLSQLLRKPPLSFSLPSRMRERIGQYPFYEPASFNRWIEEIWKAREWAIMEITKAQVTFLAEVALTMDECRRVYQSARPV